jgi:hypothetical protein
MGFMDNLANSPGNSGIFGQPSPQSPDSVLSIVNQLKDRNMADFKDKATFMSNLSMQQNRMQRIFDAQQQGPQNEQQGQQPQQGMNTVMKDPNAMTAHEKADIGIKQQGLSLEQQKMAQSGKLGQEQLDLKQQTEKLNQQKADQSHQAVIDKLTFDKSVAESKAAHAEEVLQNRNSNLEEKLAAQKAIADMNNTVHMLQLQIRDADNARNNNTRMRGQDMQRENSLDRLNQLGNTETNVRINPDGSRTTDIQRGGQVGAPIRQPDGRYRVTLPNGKTGFIPGNMLDHYMQNYHNPQQQDNNQENNDATQGNETQE